MTYDLDQSLSFGHMDLAGGLGTLISHGEIWSPRQRRALLGCEFLVAQGWPVFAHQHDELFGFEHITAWRCSDRQLKDLAGNSIHLSVMHILWMWLLGTFEPGDESHNAADDAQEPGYEGRAIADDAEQPCHEGHNADDTADEASEPCDEGPTVADDMEDTEESRWPTKCTQETQLRWTHPTLKDRAFCVGPHGPGPLRDSDS